MTFYRRYSPQFLSWRREILERDPYDVAEEVFDERIERARTAWKTDAITHAQDYPTYFQLDRDILHPVAYDMAQKQGLPLEPETVAEALHDLQNVARFRVGCHVRTAPQLDRLIDAGATGDSRFRRGRGCGASRQTACTTGSFGDGYSTVARMREELTAWRPDLPPDAPGTVAHDFDALSTDCLLRRLRQELDRFQTLPRADQNESAPHLRSLVFQLMGLCRPELEELAKDQALATPAHWTLGQQVRRWTDLSEQLMPHGGADARPEVLVAVLRKLKRHPAYHALFLERARELVTNPGMARGADVRDQTEQLRSLSPDQAYRLSSDPHALQSPPRSSGRCRAQRRTTGCCSGCWPASSCGWIGSTTTPNWWDAYRSLGTRGAWRWRASSTSSATATRGEPGFGRPLLCCFAR